MKTLPLDHAVRNAMRRPLRSSLTVFAGALVAALLVSTSAFVRSLERSHVRSAPPNTAILLSTSAEGDILRSATSPAVADIVAADVEGVLRIGNVAASSPEIHMGTDIRVDGDQEPHQAFVRGITDRAYLVHEAVTLLEGKLPSVGEAMVGRLAAAKSDLDPKALSLGEYVELENGKFHIVGVFAAPGTTMESEIWVPLEELQGLSQRSDCSTIFVRVKTPEDLAEVSLFANRRLDLELTSISADEYYAALAGYFAPIRILAWAMALLIGLASMASGANTMIATVQDRRRELATLRAIGYRGSALIVTVLQEALFLGAAGALLGFAVARFVVSQASVSMAMTAFRLEVDAVSILIGLIGTLLIVCIGAYPALRRVTRLSVSAALKDD